MTESAPDTTARESTPGGGPRPRVIERVENGLVVVLAMTATIVIAPELWWFPLAAFLAFDLSMAGYLRSPASGAALYNAVHTYVWPAALAVAGLAIGSSSPSLSRWLLLVACAWALHVGFDRMLGYGMKLPDAFTHTHLGWIGGGKSTSAQ